MAPFSDTTLLLGAGVSVEPPAGFPTAFDLVAEIIKLIAPSQSWHRKLAHLANPGREDKLSTGDYIRFEMLMEVIQNAADPSLNILGFIDLFHSPNWQHGAAAHAASLGAAILTTNFDNLLELAVIGEGGVPWTVCERSQFEGWPNGIPAGAIPIVKLHGSRQRYRGKEAQDSTHTIQTTLEGIASGGQGFALPEWKRRVVAAVVDGRRLLVAGYSGSDDFDIVPTLRTLSPAKVTWLVHQREPLPAREPVDLLSVPEERLESRDALWQSWLKHGIAVSVVAGPTRTTLADRLNLLAPEAAPSSPSLAIRTYLGDWAGAQLRVFTRFEITSDLFRRLGDYAAAYDAHVEAAAAASTKPETQRAAYLMARSHIDRNNLAEAETWTRKALALLDDDVGPRLRSLCFHQQGFLHYWNGNHTEARRWLEKSREVARDNGIAWLEAICIHDLSMILQDAGDYHGAMTGYERSIELSSQVGDLRHVAYSLHQLGTSSYELGKIDEAETYHLLASRYARTIGDLDQYGKSFHELGMCLWMRGRLAPALRLFFKSRRLARLTSVRFEPMDLQHIGICYWEASRYDKAFYYLDAAERLYVQVKDFDTVVEARSALCILLLKRGACDAANEYLKAMLEVAASTTMRDYRLRATFTEALHALICVGPKPERQHAVLAAIAGIRQAGLLSLFLEVVHACAVLNVALGPGAASLKAHAAALNARLGNALRSKALADWGSA
jgi:tetratricopeptide (TPR) repeat protein